MGNHKTTKILGLVTLALSAAAFGSACSSKTGGSSDGSGALPADVQAIVFLQRMPRTDQGNVFEYTSFVPGGRLVKLEPPSANGKLTDLTKLAADTYNANISDPKQQISFENADIMSYDLSFDAQSLVFSARTADSAQFNIFSMNMDGTNLKQLTEGANDYVYPIYLPGSKIYFTTNLDVESEMASGTYNADSLQFKDEYERATTAQVGTMNLDGSNMLLGPRNVSHRVSPALLPNGQVLYTEWRHMGSVNDGHLRQMNSDMTGMREAFGGEDGGNGGTNSYLKGRYVQTIQKTDANGNPLTDVQLVAVATSRDRTLQAGKLYLIDLNTTEALSKFTDMTPLVPPDRTPSSVGRYYDAEIIGDPNARQFLASWADGPVESEVLDLAMTTPNFGIYRFDGTTGQRFPIYDDPKYWDVLARPVVSRTEPPVTASALAPGSTSTTIGALNVYDSSVLTVPPGSVEKVRLIEGFSGEEGYDMFGTTEFDGQSLYGEIPLKSDHSFSASVPGNVPVHIQLIDKFAMSVANEPIWISGRAGENRVCGGCHENRSNTPQLAPGQTVAQLAGAVNLDVPRAQRITPMAPGETAYTAADFTYGNMRGVPWDKAIQPILDAKCVSCHDGDATKAGNPSYTVVDVTKGVTQTFVFDLRGQQLNVTVGEKMTGAYTASYISVMGLGEIIGDDVVNIINLTGGGGNQYGYVTPASATTSKIIQMLNPPLQFPAPDMNTRAFTTTPHMVEVGGTDLTSDEFYRFILNIDMGGQFYFRENHDTAQNYASTGSI